MSLNSNKNINLRKLAESYCKCNSFYLYFRFYMFMTLLNIFNLIKQNRNLNKTYLMKAEIISFKSK